MLIVPFGENQSGRSYAVRSADHRTLTEGTSRPGDQRERPHEVAGFDGQVVEIPGTVLLLDRHLERALHVMGEMVPKSTVDPLGRSKRGSDRKQ